MQRQNKGSKKRQTPAWILKVVAQEQDDGSIMIAKDENGKPIERMAPNRAMRRVIKAQNRRAQ